MKDSAVGVKHIQSFKHYCCDTFFTVPVKCKEEEVLLATAIAMGFRCLWWQGLGGDRCWGDYLLEDERHNSHSMKVSSPH